MLLRVEPYSTAGWLVGNADTTSFKSVTAFFPEDASDSNGILSQHIIHIVSSSIILIA